MDKRRAIQFQLSRLGRQFSAMTGRSRRKNGVLDQSAFQILTCLIAKGGMTISELGLAQGVDASTLSRQTSSLLRAGLIEKSAARAGAGGKIFSVTPEGASAFLHEEEQSAIVMFSMLADWRAEDREIFLTLLTRFNTALESKTGNQWPEWSEFVSGVTAAKRHYNA